MFTALGATDGHFRDTIRTVRLVLQKRFDVDLNGFTKHGDGGLGRIDFVATLYRDTRDGRSGGNIYGRDRGPPTKFAQ